MTEYARNVILDLFEEGDRDDVFLWQLIGLSEFDEQDVSRGKDRGDILEAAAAIAFFLMRDNIFSLFEVADDGGGDLNFKKFEGDLKEFSSSIKKLDEKIQKALGLVFS
ncbi:MULTISPECIES: hypothetical protein [unclassified Variovorax]|uniref:hypothetical protein n=1 Tax=unclassified Variovorax TaxID=663243 RepID=UPI002578EF1E|nr:MULTISPECIES: hypothetical protein [unclassified Variovorax]MDM0087147.1 hypothetical protein [Variovorax sp. J22G40]MDM0144596.1 hypothetical protein [Variovorax sp. J2P1-31]